MGNISTNRDDSIIDNRSVFGTIPLMSEGVYESRPVLRKRMDELERQLRAVSLALIAASDELKRLTEERKDASIERCPSECGGGVSES